MTTLKRGNYLRLQILLIEGGTVVLRNVFDNCISPHPLGAHLRTQHGVIQTLIRRGRLTIAQVYKQGTPSSQDYDITVLYCLLRSTCGLSNPNDQVWSNPAPTDTRIEAYISRLKNLRNEMAHNSSAGGLSDQDFQNKWNEVEKVLLALNSKTPIPILNLQAELNKLKTVPIDEETEERCQQELKAWQDLDAAMEQELGRIRQEIETCTDSMGNLQKLSQDTKENILKLTEQMEKWKTPEQQNLHEHSMHNFETKEKYKNFYVRTPAYEQAIQKLTDTGFVILAGNQGEGKTTMASYLLLEIAPASKILRLNRPTDWRIRSSEFCNAVLIDDIFGTTILDEELFNSWEALIPEIRSALADKKLSVVITTRQHILNAAKEKIKHQELFKAEHEVTLKSTDIPLLTKIKILEQNLAKFNRETELEVVKQHIASHWTENSAEDSRLSIGFPECAAMFASTKLSSNHPDFFKAPLSYFKKFLDELFTVEDEFVALMLVWAMPEGKLCIRDLEQKRIPEDLFDSLDYPMEVGKRNRLKSCLLRHKEGLLNYNCKTGEYSFSHTVIGDVVGLIGSQKSTSAVIKYGSKAFVMKYMHVSKKLDGSDEEDCYVVEEFRFDELSEKFCDLLFRRNSQHVPERTNVRLKEKALQNMNLSNHYPDLSILLHEAFEIESFISEFASYIQQEYIDKMQQKQRIVETPLVEVFEHFKKPYSIAFEPGSKGMCIPSVLAARGRKNLLVNCLSSETLPETEKEVALLIAVDQLDIFLIDLLLRSQTRVSEEVLQVACFKVDVNILKRLLQSTVPMLTNFDNIANKSSPLITACKRGMTDVIRDLAHVCAINYRNENDLSALDFAILKNHPGVCKVLIENGVDLNTKDKRFGRTPLHRASDVGKNAIVKLLIEAGASVDVQDHRGEYPVHSAALHGHYDVVKTLLSCDQTLLNKPLGIHGRQNLKDMTLLHYAVMYDNCELLDILIEFADASITDRYGRTPLYLASVYGKTQIVEKLLGVSDVNQKEKDGYTPLHVAVHKKHEDVVRTLILHADLNAKDKRGNTPLHTACRNGDSKIVKILLDHKDIDIRCTNKRGDTVYHVLINVAENKQSLKRGIAQCIEILRKKDTDFIKSLEHIMNQRKRRP